MNGGNLAILLGVLFAAGFLGARVVSRPAESAPDKSVFEREVPASKAAPKKTSPAGESVGFAAEMKRLTSYEATIVREDFESLLAGPWGPQAAWTWAETDPEALFLWMQENGYPDNWTGIHETIFENWFRRDPDAALAAFRKLRKSYRYHATQGMEKLLFSDDPEVARAAGERAAEFIGVDYLPDGDHGTPGVYYKGQPTLEKILALPETRAKADLIRTGMAGWARVDWKAARDWAASRPAGERDEFLRSMFAWGLPRKLTSDPEGRVWLSEFLARDESRDLRVQHGGSYAATLARSDPAAAMTWVAENLSGASLAGAMTSIVSTQVRADREAAFATVDALPPGGVREQAGRGLIVAMLQIDPTAAYERAQSVAQDGFDVSDRVWGRVGTWVAIKRPAHAHSLLADPPENLPPVFVDRMLSHLSISHPQATLEWADENLQGEQRTAIMNRMLQGWRVQDPVAAEKWEGGEGGE